MRSKMSQHDHDSMVEYLAEKLYDQELKDVRADIQGFKRPDELTLPGFEKGYKPDAVAFDKQEMIYEVETADSINDLHTEAQWKFFAEYAKQKNAIFNVVVPPLDMINARKRLRELDIVANVLPIP